jgi:hypothetical protein
MLAPDDFRELDGWRKADQALRSRFRHHLEPRITLDLARTFSELAEPNALPDRSSELTFSIIEGILEERRLKVEANDASSK